ncbi:hypothetical protein [Sporolactobacillus pectinivorans]|uniref:hypothetical protein n=1 Tax=Sporolactobacillus pectinivorans TaxID=1591408 RepID=UPI000C25E02C|nr:hypothetical protein [Sporolactobacillus pectinivorans]
MLDMIDIPRFNFIEPSHEKGSKNAEHTYFVTTDVNEAVEHYLQRIRENKFIYMTISTIGGNVCVAKSLGLNSNKTEAKIIRVDQSINREGRQFKTYTEEFIKIVEKRIEAQKAG